MQTNPLDELSINTLPDTSQPANELGQQEFLQMLIAQLENQDPLNPQESTEFTAQLATFSSLEQLVGIKEGIDTLLTSQGSQGSLRGVEVIGKTILAEGRQFAIGSNGEAPPFVFDQDGGSTSTIVHVRDSANRLVGQFDLGQLQSGRHREAWEAIGPGDIPLQPGIYSYEVEAVAGNTAVPVRTYVEGRVTGASVGGANPTLYLDDLVVPLDRVVEVNDVEAKR